METVGDCFIFANSPYTISNPRATSLYTCAGKITNRSQLQRSLIESDMRRGNLTIPGTLLA
jgi:hypothetical protein